MFSVCICARFQTSPKESYLKATKRILRYLKHTPNVGLWYPKGAKFELVGYSDSDYAGCKVERKSTSGTCQLLGRSLVSWSSKKQNSVGHISAGSCCAQILWMKATLSDFGIKFKKVPLICDILTTAVAGTPSPTTFCSAMITVIVVTPLRCFSDLAPCFNAFR